MDKILLKWVCSFAGIVIALVGFAADLLTIVPPLSGSEFRHFPRYYMFWINVSVLACGLFFWAMIEARIYKKKEEYEKKASCVQVSIIALVITFAGHAFLLSSFALKNPGYLSKNFAREMYWIPILVSIVFSFVPVYWRAFRDSLLDLIGETSKKIAKELHELSNSVDGLRRPSVEDQLLILLRRTQKHYLKRELVKELKTNESTMTNLLKKLRKDGRISCQDQRWYALEEPPLECDEPQQPTELSKEPVTTNQ